MLQDIKNTFLFSLANLFTGNKVSTEAITNALELICKQMSFERGLIYEMDYMKQLSLKEQYGASVSLLDEVLSLEAFSSLEWMRFREKEICYIKEGEDNDALEQYLLDRHHADEMAVAVISDEGKYIYGFVMLVSADLSFEAKQVDKESLTVMLSMLSNYIKGRCYRKRLNQSRLALGDILDNTGIDIYVNDYHTHDILYVNKSMAAPYGGKEVFMGEKCWKVLFPGQNGPCEFCPKYKIVNEQGIPNKIYTWDYQRTFDGSWFRVFSAAFTWEDGRIAHIISSADITDNKEQEALIENLANYDQLTKLPNRRMLLQECERCIDNAKETEQGYLLFFDIDGFKAVNDTFGHDAGDEFLVNLGEFFNSVPLLKNAIYRNGGDEFVAIVCGGAITKSNIESLAFFIRERFHKPWELKKGEVFCGISIGVACYPEDGLTAEILISIADQAMYQVKKSGGDGICFGFQLEKKKG